MMRITNSQITSMMHNSMNASSAELGKLMQQMATNKRILLPSDDPIASVRVLRVQREEASLEQFRKNIANVSGSLSTQEANLKSTSDAMLNVRDLLLWAANGSNTSEDLAAMAGELSIIEDTIFSFANVRDEEGRYLFSGTLSDTPALSFDAATQTYSLTGNDKHRQAAVANGVLDVATNNSTNLRRLSTAMRAEHQQRVGSVVCDVVRRAHAAGTGMQIMGKQRRLEVGHTESLAPRLAQVVARHECRAPVDRRATSKATAGQDRQRKIRARHEAQPLKHLVEAEGLRLRHFIGAHVHALFHDHDLEPTLSEVRGYDGATAA